MKMNGLIRHFTALFLAVNVASASAQTHVQTVNIGGNAYVTNRADNTKVTDEGVRNWSNPQTVVSAYFYVHTPQTITLSLQGNGTSTVRMSCNGKKQDVSFNSSQDTQAGNLKVKIKKPGHVRVDLKGISKAGESYANIKNVMVGYEEGKITCVHNFSNYWGRRGPSVHMNYALEEGKDYEWFYNEVTVPAEGEVMHSYYMVAGFGEGYLGMQYNSDTERRVLFSVWSPFDTQDPRNIPEDQRILLLKRGKDVHIGEFGNEGSGGQSFLRYNWKAGVTYRFLMRIHPDGKGNTIYTAYFYATDNQEWRLVAQFLRPQTNTWYRHPHSFLENFNPEQGYLTRKVYYTNQWARTTDGKWVRPTSAGFSNDATAHAGVRLDYAGGETAKKDALYLQMGGFFDKNVQSGKRFPLPRYSNEQPPQIDWNALEKMAE